MKNIQRTLILGCSLVALAGCGADEIVSPGAGGDIIINNPTPAPTPTPTPTPTGTLVTPADRCPDIANPQGLLDTGTITGPTGTYRVCQLPATFTEDTNLPQVDGLVYRIFGQVNVGTDLGFTPVAGENSVTLSVDPGAIFVAESRAFLIVQRGNRIDADGTATRPIIWTATDNVRGVLGEDADQQWGGVVLLGRARVSDCRTGGANTPANPNATCEQELEGTDLVTLFGGNNDADSSGSLTFNQFRFSGFELSLNNELQSLTTGGVGSGTVIRNIQTFNSSDDGVEFFGGQFNARNLAVIGASDDSIDVDTGARVNLDSVVVAQRNTQGDHIIELDSVDSAARPDDAIPQTVLQINSFVFRQGAGRDTAVRVHGGAAIGLTNGVMSIQRTTDTCFVFGTVAGGVDSIGEIVGIDSVVANCGTDPFAVEGAAVEADLLAAINGGTNNNIAFTITLVGAVNGAGENGVTAFNATGRSSFFSPADTFIGVANDDAALGTLFRNWTCNSAILDFGSSNGACTSIPTA